MRMTKKEREEFIRSMRPDGEAGKEYDERQKMYDILGEDYPGERFGLGGWGPIPPQLKKFYEN